MAKKTVIVNDGRDYFLVEWIGGNLNEAQESFREGKLEPVYRFNFFDKIRSELKYYEDK